MPGPLEARVVEAPDAPLVLSRTRNARNAELGRLAVEIRYSCGKRLGKCFEDFHVEPEVRVEGPRKRGAPTVRLEPVEVRGEGRLEAAEQGGRIVVLVKRGKGEGRVLAVYRVLVDAKPSPEEAEWRVLVGLRASGRQGSLELLREPVEMSVRQVSVTGGEELEVEPSEGLFDGDRFRARLRFEARLRGEYTVRLSYAGEEREETVEAGPGEERVVEAEFAARAGRHRLEAVVEEPRYSHRTLLERTVEAMEPPRTVVEGVEPPGERPRVGGPARVVVRLRNRSLATPVRLRIRGRLYGAEIPETSVEVEPGGAVEVPLEVEHVPPEGAESSLLELRITEEPGGREIVVEERLPRPQPVEVGARLEPPRLTLYSSQGGEAVLVLENRSGAPVEALVEPGPARHAEARAEPGRAVIEPGGEARIRLSLRPRALGEGEVPVSVAVRAGGVVVSRQKLSLHVRVEPGFRLAGEPRPADGAGWRVLPGEEVPVEVPLRLSAPARLEARAEGARPEPRILELGPGEAVARVRLRVAAKPGGSVRLRLSDGVHEEEVPLRFSVEAPSPEVTLEGARLHGGVPGALRLRASNPYRSRVRLRAEPAAPLEVGEWLSRAVEAVLEPRGEAVVELGVLGRRPGRGAARVRVYGEVAGLRGPERLLEAPVEVVPPVEARLEGAPDRVMLPKALPPGVEAAGLASRYPFRLVLRNTAPVPVRARAALEASGGAAVECPGGPVEVAPGEAAGLDCVLSVPLASAQGSLELLLRLEAGEGYSEERLLLEAPVERTVFLPIRSESEPRGCPYPAWPGRGYWVILAPARVEAEECGAREPEPWRAARRTARLALEALAQAAGEGWERALARYVVLSAPGVAGQEERRTSWEEARRLAEALETGAGGVEAAPGLLVKAMALRLLGLEARAKRLLERLHTGSGLLVAPPGLSSSMGSGLYAEAARAARQGGLSRLLASRPRPSWPVVLAVSVLSGETLPYHPPAPGLDRWGLAHLLGASDPPAPEALGEWLERLSRLLEEPPRGTGLVGLALAARRLIGLVQAVEPPAG